MLVLLCAFSQCIIPCWLFLMTVFFFLLIFALTIEHTGTRRTRWFLIKVKVNVNKSLSLHHGKVKASFLQTYLFVVDLDISRHSSKCKIIYTDEIRSCKVEDDTVFSADTHVANEGNQPWNEGKRCPDNAAWEPVSFGINFHGICKANHHAMFWVCCCLSHFQVQLVSIIWYSVCKTTCPVIPR